MNPRARVLFLIVIISCIVLCVESLTFYLLYRTAFKEEQARLVATAQSQARLIEAVARFDKKFSTFYPSSAREATLSQIRDAHSKYIGFGRTGEFTLSRKENDQIVFILNHRHYDLNNPKPVPWNSNLAEPMRLALSGRSGTIVGLDYRGETVLAAYEPVAELDLGIVTKIDLAEVREPFIRAGILSAALGIVFVLLGSAIFLAVINPIIHNLHQSVSQLEKALAEVKTLRGIVPICSYCKKIRDDQGYWDRLESYIGQHTEANFSHGICPECMQIHFADYLVEDDRSTSLPMLSNAPKATASPR